MDFVYVLFSTVRKDRLFEVCNFECRILVFLVKPSRLFGPHVTASDYFLFRQKLFRKNDENAKAKMRCSVKKRVNYVLKNVCRVVDDDANEA